MSDNLSALESWLSRDMLHDKTRDFPSEIMTEIFTLTCGDEVLIPPLDHGYPRTLGYVCSRWRQILWNSPSIWSKIKVGDGYGHVSAPAIHMQKYSAGDVLNYILSNISFFVSLTVSRGGWIMHVSTIILERFDRFVELSIDGLPQHMLISFLHLPQDKFTVLEKLSLSALHIDEPIPDDTTLPTRNGA